MKQACVAPNMDGADPASARATGIRESCMASSAVRFHGPVIDCAKTSDNCSDSPPVDFPGDDFFFERAVGVSLKATNLGTLENPNTFTELVLTGALNVRVPLGKVDATSCTVDPSSDDKTHLEAVCMMFGFGTRYRVREETGKLGRMLRVEAQKFGEAAQSRWAPIFGVALAPKVRVELVR